MEKSVQLKQSYGKDAGEILSGSDDCERGKLKSDVPLSKNMEVISELTVPSGKEYRSGNEDETNPNIDEKNELRRCNFTCKTCAIVVTMRKIELFQMPFNSQSFKGHHVNLILYRRSTHEDRKHKPTF